jgi:hypothetical protein
MLISFMLFSGVGRMLAVRGAVTRRRVQATAQAPAGAVSLFSEKRVSTCRRHGAACFALNMDSGRSLSRVQLRKDYTFIGRAEKKNG